ncbi:uncharacterized protein LOC144015448 [Festucalex cinctus]
MATAFPRRRRVSGPRREHYQASHLLWEFILFQRDKTRVYIVAAFARWREMRNRLGLGRAGAFDCFLLDRSTAKLEGFQNHILMYTSIHAPFKYITDLQEKKISRGESAAKLECPECGHLNGGPQKASVLYHQYLHLPYLSCNKLKSADVLDLLTRCLKPWSDSSLTFLSSQIGMPRMRTLEWRTPEGFGVVPPVSLPTISELQQTEVSRRLGPADQVSEAME